MQKEVSTAASYIVDDNTLAAESPAHLVGLQTCGALLGSILPYLHLPSCQRCSLPAGTLSGLLSHSACIAVAVQAIHSCTQQQRASCQSGPDQMTQEPNTQTSALLLG